MKILIPNATGPSNIGDQAILHGLLSCLRSAYSDIELTILTSKPEGYADTLGGTIEYNLYMYSVFENTNPFVRLWRLAMLAVLYFANKYGMTFLQKGKIQSLIDYYKEADLIVFVGGGYLRTKKGMTQFLNLFMNLCLFWFAGLSRARKIVACFSFGPFAYAWQEKFAAESLRHLESVLVRENFSYQALQKYKGINAKLNTDTALFLDALQVKKLKEQGPVVGFTIRQWLNAGKQRQLADSYAGALIMFAEKYQAKIQPIVQVDAAEYGENDFVETRKVYEMLKKSSVEVLPIINIKNFAYALSVYGSLDLLLGMRMHSNIIAATQGVPFVAVSYEYKTEGISKTLNAEKFTIKSAEVSPEILFRLLCGRYETALESNGYVLTDEIKKYKKELLDLFKISYMR